MSRNKDSIIQYIKTTEAWRLDKNLFIQYFWKNKGEKKQQKVPFLAGSEGPSVKLIRQSVNQSPRSLKPIPPELCLHLGPKKPLPH